MFSIDQKLPSNKVFGHFFSAIFLAFSIYFYYKNLYIFYHFFFFVSFYTILITLLAPSLLAPFNKCWFRLGILFGRISNPLVLGFIYFCIVSPYAILGKICRRDVLSIKKDDSTSYWHDVKPITEVGKGFKNQY